MNPIIYDTKDIYIGHHPTNNKINNLKHSNQSQRINKIDNIDNTDKLLIHKTISPELSRKIRQKRCDMKLTQKELARLINERLDVVQNYENGKAIFNNNIYNKLNKVLKLNSN
jgi:putative transcription factor